MQRHLWRRSVGVPADKQRLDGIVQATLRSATVPADETPPTA
ncbi:MAG: hypothetical protein ACK4ME_02410 [Fimbriimonadales bacterium]